MQWKDYLGGIGLLNVHLGVDLVNPTKKNDRNALKTTKGNKKTLPTSVSCITLDWWKLYLDSCATYHTLFADWYLHNVNEVDIVTKSNYNAGVTINIQTGWFGVCKMWLNK